MNRLINLIQLINGYLYLLFYSVYEFFSYGAPTRRPTKNLPLAKLILNGASFPEELEGRNDHADLFACNDFCLSERYQKIQPNNYVIADQQFYGKSSIENAPPKISTLLELNTKTTWSMNLYVPLEARKSSLTAHITNPKIKLFYFSKAPLPGHGGLATHIFFKYGAMPYIANVSIAMLSIAIKTGHREINMYGLDMSYYKFFSVNEKNMSILQSSYFYDEQSHSPYMIYSKREGGYRQGSSKIFFERIYQTILSHEIISKIAVKHNVLIKNYSPESIVDTYEKA